MAVATAQQQIRDATSAGSSSAANSTASATSSSVSSSVLSATSCTPSVATSFLAASSTQHCQPGTTLQAVATAQQQIRDATGAISSSASSSVGLDGSHLGSHQNSGKYRLQKVLIWDLFC